MAVLKARSRIISIRLFEEEYSALKDLCSLTGARSISELARDAMHALQANVNRVDERISRDEFRAQVNRLDRKIELLAAGITSSEKDSDAE